MVCHKVGRALCSYCAVVSFVTLLFGLSYAQERHGEATCMLRLQGNGAKQQGIATAELACTASSPIAVIINTTYLRQAFHSVSGVTVVSNADCRAATASLRSGGVLLPPAYPLLTFCNGSITLQQPVIQDLWINPEPVTDSGSPVILAFAGNSIARVVQGSFTNNNAGSALLLVQQASVTVQNSVFNDSIALRGGAALALGRSALTIKDSTFTSLEGTVAGGALYLTGSASTAISSSNFTNNRAPNGGGVLAVYASAQTIIENCMFSDNVAEEGAKTGGSAWGGVLYSVDNAETTISNSVLFNNKAKSGGCSFLDFNSTLTVRDSLLYSNSASEIGGVLNVGYTAVADFVNCTVRNNSAGVAGGAFGGFADASLYLDGSLIAENSAQQSGGAIFLQEAALCEVSGTTFRRNAADNGGAFEAQGNATLTLSDSNFVLNTATSFGGALSVIGSSTVLVQDCNGTNNTANVGGFLSTTNFANTSIASSRFISNSAEDGGALHAVDSAVLLVADTYFAFNNASEGGSVGCANSAQVNLTGGTDVFASNASIGGGVYAFDACKVTLQGDTAVTNGTADKGAGVAVWDSAQLSVSADVVIAYNHARESGGGVHLASPHFSAEQLLTVVHNNTAPFNDNIAVVPTNISMLGNSSVMTFVGRLGNENMLPVSLIVIGHQGLPVQGELVQCVLIDGSVQEPQFLGLNRSANGGEAYLSLRIWKPPAMYVLSCYTPDARTVVPANVSLYIRACTRGEITPSPDTCQECPSGYYSFNPVETLCRRCPDEVATCPGGAQLLPVPGAWRSTANSTQVHRCPNPSACRPSSGSTAVASCESDPACRESSNFSNLMCTTGFEGNLCGVCAPGYGSFKPFSCRPCLAYSTILGLYIAASVIMLIFMKILVEVTMSANQETAAATASIAALQHSGGQAVMHQPCTFQDLDSMRAAKVPPPMSTKRQQHWKAGLMETELTPAEPKVAAPAGPRAPGFDRSETMESVAPPLAAAATMPVGSAQAGSATCSTKASPQYVARLLPSDLLRPLLLYSQYLLVIGSMGIDFPDIISYPIRALAWFWSPASPATLSADCLMQRGAALPFAIQRTLFYLFMPLAMLLALLALEAAILKVKHRASIRVGLADRLWSAVLVAGFFFLPSVSATIFSMFACVPIDQPPSGAPYTAGAVGSFWSVDLNVQCWHGYHLGWALGLGVPLLLLVCCGLPAGILYVVLSNKSRLQDPMFVQHYGFLFRAYKPKYCWWEAVIAVETMVLVAVSVFGASLGPYFQGLVMNAALAITAMLLLACKPHAHFVAYRISLYAVCCLLFTSYTSLSFLPYGNQRAGSVYGEVMGTLVLLVNIGFVFYVGYKLYKQVDWRGLLQGVNSATQHLTFKASSLLTTLSSGDFGKQLSNKADLKSEAAFGKAPGRKDAAAV